MTDAQTLERIRDILHEYKDDDMVFEQPPSETEQQKNFREDLRAVVLLAFTEDADIPSHLSTNDLKERLRKIWDETKSDSNELKERLRKIWDETKPDSWG